MDKLYKLAQIPNKGRGLIALQNLSKGQLLFAERPIVSVMREDKLGKYCSYCYNPLQTDEMDNQSFDSYHIDCNDIGWKELSFKFCGVRNRDYKVMEDKKFPIMARLILSNTLEQTLNTKPTLWDGILGHLCFAKNEEWNIDKEPYDEWIEYVMKNVNSGIQRDELLNIIPFEMYDRIIRILHLNCITIPYNNGQNKEDEDIATGLFGLGSFFNHSCEPNVELMNKMEYQSGYAKFQTISDIKEGEELHIQYAGKNDTFEDRQKYLMWVYGFVCQCSKCTYDKIKLNDSYKND
eukprot:177357_1